MAEKPEEDKRAREIARRIAQENIARLLGQGSSKKAVHSDDEGADGEEQLVDLDDMDGSEAELYSARKAGGKKKSSKRKKAEAQPQEEKRKPHSRINDLACRGARMDGETCMIEFYSATLGGKIEVPYKDIEASSKKHKPHRFEQDGQKLSVVWNEMISAQAQYENLMAGLGAPDEPGPG